MKTRSIVLILGALALLGAVGYGLYSLMLNHGGNTRMDAEQISDANKNASSIHHGEGRVELIGDDVITVSHGSIPSLQWEPMTMDFKLPAKGVSENIAIGDIVGFDFRRTSGGEFEIVRMTRLAAAPPQEHEHLHDSGEHK